MKRLTPDPYHNRAAIKQPEDFYGRHRELADLYGRILSGQSVSLIGERRIGKSSLLYALDFDSSRRWFEVPEELLLIYLDMMFVARRSEGEVVRYMAGLIANALDIDLDEEDGEELGREALIDLANKAGDENRHLAIVIDEFDVLLYNENIPEDFFSFLRAWASAYSVSFTVASREGHIEPVTESVDSGSPFLNIFGVVYVGPLEPGDVSELIHRPSAQCGVPFDDDDERLLLSLAGYHPYYLQIACSDLFKLKQREDDPEAIRRQLTDSFRLASEQQFDYLWGRLSERERNLLTAQSNLEDSSDTRALSDLRRKGVVIDIDDEPRIFSSVFAEMVAQRAEDTIDEPNVFARALDSLLERS